MKRRLLSLLIGGLAAGSMGVAYADIQGVGEPTTKSVSKLAVLPAAAQSAATPDQVARLQEKLRLIGQILGASSASVQAQPNAAEAAKWAREAMYGMSLEQVSAVGMPTTFRALSDSIAKARVTPKALGAASTDLVFFPFPPCRYIDTRNVGGKITGARGFDFANSGNTYGGDVACNLATLSGASQNAIAAVSLNMTIVDTSTAAAPGFATARPAGATQSTALVNWTVSSAGFQLGNAAVITTDQSGSTNELEIFTSGAVHAIVDVAGVFAAPTATALACVNVFNATTSTLAPNSFTQFQDADIVACPTGYTATNFIWDYVSGSGGMAPWENAIANAQPTGNISLGFTHVPPNASSAGTTITFTPGRRCCRVPGR